MALLNVAALLRFIIINIKLKLNQSARVLYRWGQVTITKALLSELLPGPVTVVFERTLELNSSLNPGTPLVGIRVPDHGFVRDVARHCKEPLALTSANVSNAPSTLSIQVHNLHRFEIYNDYVILHIL